MTKEGIAEVLEQIATLLELKDENPFKIRAYTNAARSLETFGGNLGDLKDEETLEKIPGIGKAIAAKIKELAETGSLKFFEELRAEFPGAILELFSIPGFGAKKIKALYEKLHVQLDRGTAIGLRERKSGGASRLRENDAGKTLPGDRDARETQRLVSTWPDRGRSRIVANGFARASRCVTGLRRRKLSAPQGNRARSRFHRRDEGAGRDNEIVCRTSAGRERDRAGSDEKQRAFALGNSMRSARRDVGRISVRAQLFYRQQGAQHRDA